MGCGKNPPQKTKTLPKMIPRVAAGESQCRQSRMSAVESKTTRRFGQITKELFAVACVQKKNHADVLGVVCCW